MQKWGKGIFGEKNKKFLKAMEICGQMCYNGNYAIVKWRGVCNF